jgi:hypothetical protein
VIFFFPGEDVFATGIFMVEKGQQTMLQELTYH